MGFYDQIAKYYDDIFPISKDTVSFLKASIGNSSKDVLDIACGTGMYAIELSNEGYKLSAIDLDERMIENLNNKVNKDNLKIKFLQGDMKELGEKFKKHSFDAVYCIGNSLVHIDSFTEIKELFISIKELLKGEGKFIFQIINYDRIICKGIKSLPTIINNDVPLEFERYYDYDKLKNKVIFKTVLSVKNEKIENSICLTPLTCDKAIDLLHEAGFYEINVYGDFKGNKFDKDNSYALVIEAK